MAFTTTTLSPFKKFCQDEVFLSKGLDATYSHWFVLPAVIIMVCLCLLEKRRNVKRELFDGRPGLIRAFSFLDEPRNRWGIMFAFGAVTGNIVQMTLKTFSEEFPIWAKIFLVYILALETSLISYPLFACMTTRHKLVGALTGLLYSAGWAAFKMFVIVQTGRCFEESVQSTGQAIIADVPTVVCSFLVMVKFAWKLYRCLVTKKYVSSEEHHNRFCHEFQVTYVRTLLARRQIKQPLNNDSILKVVWDKLVKPTPGFRYPIAMLITAMTSVVLIFYVTSQLVVSLQLLVREALPHLSDLDAGAAALATIFTVLCGLRNIYLVQINYRRDMLLLYKGDISFIPATLRDKPPNLYMAQGLRFVGNAIVGAFWGSIFCYLAIYIPLFLVFVTFRELETLDKTHLLFNEFQWLIYPVCMIIIFQVQVFLVRRFFMQPRLNPDDPHKPLALDNKLVYDVFSFFMVFLNASIGMVQYIKRIFISFILGVFLIGRMDRPLLIRGYESMDKCYTNYIGMILVDKAHNHPVMRVFCQIVRDAYDVTRSRTLVNTDGVYANVEQVYSNIRDMQLESGFHVDDLAKKNTMAYRRWMVAYTLIKNPSLVQYRVHGAPAAHPYDVIISMSNDVMRGTDVTKTEPDNNDDTDFVYDTFGCKLKCCSKRYCRIPPNITTNILVAIVVISCLLIVAGMKVLIPEFSKSYGFAAN